MSNQIMKSFTMLTLVVALALAANVVSANGQLASSRLIADIPFDFIVGDVTLPSGNYTVRAATSNGDGLRISSRDGKRSVIRLSNSIAEKSQKRTARMVFRRYGQQYFLAEVWTGEDHGLQLMKSKRERNLRSELAKNTSQSESGSESYQTVEVVALVR